MAEPPAPALVVKIGGGLLRAEGLDGLRRGCDEAARLARRQPVLVVPGGGPFADAVRAVDGAAGLGERISHRLALAAMDQLGILLGELLPAAERLTRLRAPSELGLLRAAPAFAGRADVPASWAVTSDSLAVLAAGAIGARHAILLKPVAGVLASWPSTAAPLPELTAEQLRALQSGGEGRAVDAYLSQAIDRTGVTVTVRAPGRRPSSGTRISPG